MPRIERFDADAESRISAGRLPCLVASFPLRSRLSSALRSLWSSSRDLTGTGVGIAVCVAAVLALAHMRCTTEAVEPPAPPPPERFIDYSPERIQAEIVRLERLLADPSSPEWRDSTLGLTRVDVTADLFALLVHRRNPSPDYSAALARARFLFEHVGQKRLYYSSWGRLLKEHVELSERYDSLTSAVDSLGEADDEAEKELRRRAFRQSARIDSLEALARQQEETIRQLRQLDVQMDRQRSRMQ